MTYDPHDEPEPTPAETCVCCGAAMLELYPGSGRATCPNGCGGDQ